MKPIYDQLSEFTNKKSHLINHLNQISPSLKLIHDEIINLRAQKESLENDSRNKTKAETHFAPAVPYPCFGCIAKGSVCVHFPTTNDHYTYVKNVPDFGAREEAERQIEQIENEIGKKQESLAPIKDRITAIEAALALLDKDLNTFLLECFKKINFQDQELLLALTDKDKNLLDFFEKVSVAYANISSEAKAGCAEILLKYYSCLKLPTANAFAALNAIELFKKIFSICQRMFTLSSNINSSNIAWLINSIVLMELPIADFKKEIQPIVANQIKTMFKTGVSADHLLCLKQVFELNDPALTKLLISLLNESSADNLLNELDPIKICTSREYYLAYTFKMLMLKSKLDNTDLLLASATLTEMNIFEKSFSTEYLGKRQNELALAVKSVCKQFQQESNNSMLFSKWVRKTLLLAEGHKQDYLILLITDHLSTEAIKCAYETNVKIEMILVHMELLSLLFKINEPSYDLIINTAAKKLFNVYLLMRNEAKITEKSAQIEDEFIKWLAKSESSTSDLLLNYFKARIKYFTVGAAELTSMQNGAEAASNLQELLDTIQKPIGFFTLLTNSVKNFRNTSSEQVKIIEQIKQVLAISNQGNQNEKQKNKKFDELSTTSVASNSTSYRDSAQSPATLLTQQSAVFSSNAATNSTTISNVSLLGQLEDIHPPDSEPSYTVPRIHGQNCTAS